MQHVERGRDALTAYHEYLQSDHDYQVWVEILTLEEREVGEAVLLDGQVNYSTDSDDGPERTASVVLSDPEGALQFGTQYAEDDSGTIWVNRLVRLKHEVEVPGWGLFTTTCMVGLPTAASRQGGEVGLELGDKSLLMDHGVRPRTFKRGTNVRVALVALCRMTGEHHYRIPKTDKKLSKPYTVGMGEDSLTPWAAFKQIAGKEKGWRAYFSADGYATCEPTKSQRPLVVVQHVLSLPDSSTSFTDFINYVKATSRRKIVNRKKTKRDETHDGRLIATVFTGVAALPRGHRLSEESLSRHGEPQTRPLLIEDDGLRNANEVSKAARDELEDGSKIESEDSLECMPFFHLDKGDRLDFPMGIGVVKFDEASVPLGTGGNMSIGRKKWVSAPVKVRKVKSKRRVIKRKKKKGGKKDG
jgi:hypothetical protein